MNFLTKKLFKISMPLINNISCLFFRSLFLFQFVFTGCIFFHSNLLLAAAEQDGVAVERTALNLSTEEITWLKEHPVIQLGTESNWPPYEFVDQSGELQGVTVDIIKILEKQLGVQLKINSQYSWEETLEKIRNHDIDIVSGISKSPEREKYLIFTHSYFTPLIGIYTRKDDITINHFDDLKNKTVVVENQYFSHEELAKKHPEIKLLVVETTTDALKALSYGKADAYIGDQGATNWVIEKNALNNIKVTANSDPDQGIDSRSHRLAVRDDWVIFQRILNEALASIAEPDMSNIRRKWLGVDSGSKKIALSKAEQQWLDQHKVIRFTGDPNWLPYEAFDDKGNYIGIVAEYLKRIEEKLGISVDIVPTQSWAESIAKVKRGEIDVLSETSDSALKSNLTFTQPYVGSPIVIIMKSDSGHIENLNQIKHKNIAVIKDYGYVPQILKRYPDVAYTEVDTIQDGLLAVSTGKVDVLLATLAQASYHMSNLGISNIHVVGKTEFNTQLAFGMSHEFAPLIPLFNRALDAISEPQRRDILQHWIGKTTSNEAQPTITLTIEEQQWLDAHPVVRVANEDDWPPYDFSIKGKPQGYSIDLLRLIAEKTGLNLEFVNGHDWDRLLQMATAGELNILPAIWRTEEREKNFNFTSAYHEDSGVLIVRNDSTLSTIKQLDGRVLSVVRGFSTNEVFKHKYPDIHLLEVDDVNKAMLAVSIGKADAYIGSHGVTSYIIQENHIPGLKIANVVTISDKKDIGHLYMATPKQDGILSNILQKGLDAVSLKEKRELQARWILEIAPVVSAPVEKSEVKKWLFFIASGLILIVGILFIASRWIPSEVLVQYFGSGRFRLPALVAMTLIIILVGIAINYTLQQSRRESLSQVQTNLTGTLLNVVQQVENWVDERFNFLQQLGKNAQLVDITNALLKLPVEPNVLKTSAELIAARNFFSSWEEQFGSSGFFLINPQMINIGSARDSNIGKRNLIAEQRPDLMNRAFAGEVVFIPPIVSDINLSDIKTDDSQITDNCGRQCMSMFFAVPILNKDNDVIAVLTQRLSTSEGLSIILRSGRIGDSGESYAFNANGLLASETRFREQLIKAGVLTREQHEVGTIEVRDPGRNLLQKRRMKIHKTLGLTSMADELTQLSKVGIGRKRSKLHTNFEGYNDYRGISVFGAGLWSFQLGVGITTEVDVDEALAGYHQLKISLLGIASILLLLFVSAVLFTLTLAGRAGQSMRRSRDELEALVSERTSELEHSQEELLTSNKRISLAAETMKLGIWDWDLKTRLTTWDKRMFEIYGMPEKHPMDYALWEESIVPEDLPRVQASQKKAFEDDNDGKDQVEFRIRRADGSQRHIYAAGAVVKNANQEPIRVIGVNWDITPQKEAEQALKEAKKEAEAATRAKAEFLANMSHEIRTPMNAVIGMSHLALNTELDDKQRDYVEKIKFSGQNLLTVINDILDFSKIEAGKLDIEHTEFLLDSVLENLLSMIGLPAEKKGVEIIFKRDTNISNALVGDPLRIGQILLNLTQNAIKFTESGNVTLSVQLLKKYNNKQQLEFSVSDTGIGIPKKQLEQLFEAFVQADASTTRQYGGTGLGLSISQQLVHLMGGQLSVQSVVSEGSTFSFTLELAVQKNAPLQIFDSATLKGFRILFVDDHPVAQQALLDILASFPFDVSTAASAKQAYSMLTNNNNNEQTQAFDMVILDSSLSDTAGLDAASYIKNVMSLQMQPFILLMATYGLEGNLSSTDRENIDACLIKPATPSSLFNTIHETLYKSDKKRAKTISTSHNFNGTVLLVEDNILNQQVAKELLENLGLLVVIADSGGIAIQCIRETEYDLVFMDIQMPGIDGFETTQQIRKKLHNVHLPIIAMTAHAMAGDKERCLDAGMNDYISKPIDPEALSQTIQHWLKPGLKSDSISGGAPDNVDGSAPGSINKPVNKAVDWDARVSGINIKLGLSRVANNSDLYIDLLQEFLEKYSGTAVTLHQYLANDSLEEAGRLMHTVCGLAGTIGAVTLQNDILEMSHALQKNNVIEEKVQDDFAISFNELVHNIGVWLSQKNTSGNTINHELMQDIKLDDEILMRITQLLESGKPEGIKLLARINLQGLEHSNTELIDLALNHAKNYDFLNALSNLSKLKI